MIYIYIFMYVCNFHPLLWHCQSTACTPGLIAHEWRRQSMSSFCWHGLFLSNSIQVHKVTCITLFTFQCSSVSLWDMTYALPFGFKHILHQRISSHLWHVNQRGNGSRNGSMFVFPLMSDHRNMSGVTFCGLVDWRRHT